MKKIGSIKQKSAKEICSSRLGIGFEKLDRDAFDPEKASYYTLRNLASLFAGDIRVSELPDSMVERDAFGGAELHLLPIRDYPLFLVFGEIK